MGKVVAVNISAEKGTPKKSVKEINLLENHGVIGDAHAGNWHRQVSFLAKESIDKMTSKGIMGLCFGKFAENITTEGIELYKLPVGKKIRIGETEMEITQIGKQCHKGCTIFVQVGDCVMPKEGIFAKVIKGGTVIEGMDIIIEE